MNPVNFHLPHPMPHWVPMLPPDPPRSSSFWNTDNISHQLKELQNTLSHAKSLEKELEALIELKDAKGSSEIIGKRSVAECLRYLEDRNMDLKQQESLSVEAANSLMLKLRAQLEPFRIIVDENSPWEEKSSAVRLACKIKKAKKNKGWRKRKRQRVAEMRSKETERFEQADREADEWRARGMEKDMADRKVEEMKAIEKIKTKRERRRLEPELELALVVEELKKLRSLRIEKLKKQGHFLPEEDDKFFERVRAAVEQEENSESDKIISATEEIEKKMRAQGTTEVRKEADISCHKDIEEETPCVPDSSEKRKESLANAGALENVANLPFEFYHYYYGSNYDMGRLIEIRREWDAYLREGGSRIPGHWVQPPPPANEIWASYLVSPTGHPD